MNYDQLTDGTPFPAIGAPGSLARRRAAWRTAYTKALKQAVTDHPDEYGPILKTVDIVAERMIDAVDKGTFNHDGRAFKMACKLVGIKYGRKRICDFYHKI